MILDFCVLVILILYALLGFTRGLLAQLLGLVGITAAWVLAPMLAPYVRKLIFSSDSQTWAHLEVASLLIGAVAVLIACQLVFQLIPDLLRRWSDALRRLDSTLGTAVGLVRGAITAYLMLYVMIYAESPKVRRFPDMARQMNTSQTVVEVRKRNLLTTLQFGDLETLRRGLVAWKSKAANKDDAVAARELGQVPAFRSAAGNKELRQMARDGRYSALLDHPMVHELLADQRVRDAIEATVRETRPQTVAP